MSKLKSLEKIWHIREKELHEAQGHYQRAVDFFETQATELYYLLKKKEDLTAQLESRLKKRVTITYINTVSESIQRLDQQEKELQKKVHQARVNMEQKELQLKEAHMEMKKMEKLHGSKTKQMKEIQKKQESNFMDEISIQQYYRMK